ncbi:MAG: pyridoxamine 5'-phosphate oxidase family protein [Cellulosilyticaceae bacterium]
MNTAEVFKRLMKEQKEIALATCRASGPNVRVVNFYYDEEVEGVIYFSSFGDNEKIAEFAQNDSVAFTTIPHEGNEHVRVKEATVQKSRKTVYDVKEGFVRKIPEYEMTIQEVGEYLVLFEVHFKEADVTLDFEQSGVITF